MPLTPRVETTYSIRYWDEETQAWQRDRNLMRVCEMALRWIPEINENLEEAGWKIMRRLRSGDWVRPADIDTLMKYLQAAKNYYVKCEFQDQPYPQRNEEAIRDINDLLDEVNP